MTDLLLVLLAAVLMGVFVTALLLVLTTVPPVNADPVLPVLVRRIGRAIRTALNDPNQVILLLVIYVVVACVALLVFEP